MADHAHISVENGGALVYLDGTLEELRSLIEFLLLKADVTQAPPCVIVPLIGGKGSLVALLGRIEIFISDIFMATKSMRVSEVVVKLNSS